MHAGPDPTKPSDPGDLSTFDDSGGTTLPAPPFGRGFEKDQLFGRYRLIQRLGSGGFGEVWEVEGLETSRRQALKVLTETRSPIPVMLERFKREGKLAASVNHPRCVFVFGAEEIDGYPVILMELMTGGTLQDRLDKGGPVPFREAVDMILDVIEGLEASNQVGILHRDIKPSNCFVDQTGRCKIGDFGISKSLETPADLTVTGGFVGTPTYSSPEQIRGSALDVRTDIYSTGATLYALIAGKPPFHGARAAEVLARIVADPPPHFSAYSVRVPPGLERAISRTMSKEKGKRYGTYAELRSALLPFSSNGLTAGRLVRRAIAYGIDATLASIGIRAVLIVGGGSAWQAIAVYFIYFLYLAFTEKLWGRGLGKYLMNLRVTTSDGAPLTYRHAFLRTTVWFGPNIVNAGLGMVLAPSFFFQLLRMTVQVVPFITMRAHNGYAGIHELLSGTRVMMLKKREAIAVPTASFRQNAADAVQLDRRGPYAVVGELWRTETEALLWGYDEVLSRRVWIFDYPSEHAQPIGELIDVRPGRLRWLLGSREGTRNWDAYEATSGIGFCEWVLKKKGMAWAEMRQIILGAATEIQIQIDRGQLDAVLSPSYFWIDSLGTARLLCFPAPRSDGSPTPVYTMFHVRDWRSFLQELTYLGLTGRARPVVNAEKAALPIPLPEHARTFVELLCGSTEKLPPRPGVHQTSPSAIAEELKRNMNQSAKLTRVWRAGPAAAAMAPILLALVPLVLLLLLTARRPILPDLTEAQAYQDALRNIPDERLEENRQFATGVRKAMAYSYTHAQSSTAGRTRLGQLPPDLRLDLEAAAGRFPTVSDTEAAEGRLIAAQAMPLKPQPIFILGSPAMTLRLLPSLAAFYGLIAAVCSILMAALFGTGPLFRIFRLSLQKRDGETAARFRCTLRAVVAWLPFLLPFTISRVMPLFNVSTGPFLQSVPLSLLAISLAMGGWIYSLVRPEKGIPDAIAGTYLVPR